MISDAIELEAASCPLCSHDRQHGAFAFDPYEVVRCAACGFHYLSPRPTEAAMLRLYRHAAYFEAGNGGASGYQSYERQEGALRKTFRRLLGQLRRRGLAGGDLLEVGCGYGYLLDEARDCFDRRVGTDFSQRAAAQAATVADAAYAGGIDAVPAGQRFDFIIATQVIEHVYRPDVFLDGLRQRLKPGGSMLIATPDMGSLWRKCMGRRWPSFKLPEHVAFFDGAALRRVMQGAGLGRVRPIPYPHAFPLPLVAAKLGLGAPAFLDRCSVWLPGTTIALCGTLAGDG